MGQSSGHGLTSAGFNTPILGGTDAKGGSDKAMALALMFPGVMLKLAALEGVADGIPPFAVILLPLLDPEVLLELLELLDDAPGTVEEPELLLGAVTELAAPLLELDGWLVILTSAGTTIFFTVGTDPGTGLPDTLLVVIPEATVALEVTPAVTEDGCFVVWIDKSKFVPIPAFEGVTD